MDYNKPIFTVTVGELITVLKNELITSDVQVQNSFSHEKNFKPIKGILGLAKFLGVSTTTAQRLKNEGRFEYFQTGRTLLFDPEKVRKVMEGKKK